MSALGLKLADSPGLVPKKDCKCSTMCSPHPGMLTAGTGHDHVDGKVMYDDGSNSARPHVMEFRGDRVAHERIYIMDPWDAPEWREPWRAETPADPPPPPP